MKKMAMISLGALISLTCLFYAVKEISLPSLKQVFWNTNLWYAIPLLLAIALFFVVKALRWRWLLLPVREIEIAQLAPSMMIGTALNYLLFGYVGEAARTYLLGKQVRMRKSPIFASIVLERILDMLAILALLCGVFLFTLNQIPLELLRVGYLILGLSLAAMGLVLFMVFCDRSFFWACNSLMRFLPEHLAEQMMERIEVGVTGLHSVKSPRLLAFAAAASLCQWLLMGGCNMIAMRAVGIEAPFFAALIAMALIVLGVALPSIPGHIGVIQACYWISLQGYGVDPAKTLIAAIFFHLLVYGAVIFAAFWYLKNMHLTLSQVKQEAEEKKR